MYMRQRASPLVHSAPDPAGKRSSQMYKYGYASWVVRRTTIELGGPEIPDMCQQRGKQPTARKTKEVTGCGATWTKVVAGHRVSVSISKCAELSWQIASSPSA